MNKYSDDETERLREAYTQSPSRETVAALAVELGRSERSIIGKLSKLGIYQSAVYRTKRGEIPITKLELVEIISELLNCESVKLRGLDKTPKEALKFLKSQIEELTSCTE